MKRRLLLFLFSLFFAFEISAQTHFPIYNPSLLNAPAQPDTDSFEKLVGQWSVGLNEVKQQVHASDKDFESFIRFNQPYIDSERSALVRQAQSGKINFSNITPYINGKKQKLQALYNKFLDLKKQNPNLVQNPGPLNGNQLLSYTPPTCNPACTNMNFADANFTGWYGYYGVNNSVNNYSITGVTGGALGAVQKADYDPNTGTYQIHLTSSSHYDWFLNTYHNLNMPQASPWGNGYSAMIGDSLNVGAGVATLTQEFQVTAQTNSITYAYAVLLENPSSHSYYEQPFFSITLFDQNGDTIKNCGEYDVVSRQGIPGFKGEYYSPRGDTIYFKSWSEVNAPLTQYVGQCVTIQFQVGDCSLTGHSGYAYVDAACSTFSIVPSSPFICGNETDTLYGPFGDARYLWFGPSNNSIVTNDTLPNIVVDSPGTYTLIVTPFTGSLCDDTLHYTLTPLPPVKIAMSTPTNILCNGGTASDTVNVVAGIPSYIYSWAPWGGTNAIATGLVAGTYTVAVTDKEGCSASASITITQPLQLTGNLQVPIYPLCNGDTGMAVITASGGTSPYTYSWSPPGGTNIMATGLSVGTYTVKITDHNGCTATASVAITQPAVLTDTMGAPVNVLCNGGKGSATVTPYGGTSPYTYSWDPSGGTTATGALSAGTYTVTVTDLHGCTASASVTITQPPSIVATFGPSTSPPCFGDKGGSLSVTASGGVSPYHYSWNPSNQTNATATNLGAGTYTVEITDNSGCTATASISLTQPLLLKVTIGTFSNVACNGGHTGTATAAPSGGTAPYKYSWTPIGGTNITGTGFTPGTFTVTVTDSNGCTASTYATISQPPILTATIKPPVDILCNSDSDGIATVVGAGGVSPYTYSWSPGGSTNATATNLPASICTVTVTDKNGCTATADVSITGPPVLTATISGVINVACNGSDNGSANVTASGGVAPYAYSWTPSGGTNLTGTGFAPGTYTITVTDKNGCTSTADVSITEPTTLSATMGAYTNVFCSGGYSGNATVNVTGGVSPYTYSWNPSGETNISATGLSAGSYTVTVTDNQGCTKEASVNITQPPNPLTINATGPPSDCYKNPITLSSTGATGGMPPYAYNWEPGGGTNTSMVTKPAATTLYTLTVTDSNGCTATAVWQVYVAQLHVTVTGADTTICLGQSVNLEAVASGGYGAYHYLWLPSNLPTAFVSFTPLRDTVLTVIITDGCDSQIVTQNVAIKVQALPIVSFSANIFKGCIPLCVQFKELGSSAGISQWKWGFGDGDSVSEQSPIYCFKDTGAFSVSLTETSNIGCSSTLKNINMIDAYSPPKANFTYSPQPVNILSPEVQFIDQSTGKYPIAEWFWRFGQGDSTSRLQNPNHYYADTGNFCPTLTIMDEHGCMDSATSCFDINPLFTLYIPDAFSPNGDGINDVFLPKGSYIQSFEMYIYDRWGMRLFHSTNINDGWNGTVDGGKTIAQEDIYIYMINVTDSQGNQHSYTGKVTLLK